MRKNFYLIALLLLIVSTNCFSQKNAPVIEWEVKSFDSSDYFDIRLYDAIKGEFYHAGFNGSTIFYNKINYKRETIYNKKISTSSYLNGINYMQDGGMVLLAANPQSSGTSVYKINSIGIIEWEKYIEALKGNFNYVYNSITETSDGYLIYNNLYADIVKIGENGDFKWKKNLLHYKDDYFKFKFPFIKVEDEDAHLYLGYYGNKISVFKLDEQANLIWENSYGGSNNEELVDYFLDSDGSCYILCHTESSDGDISQNKGKSDIWLIKIDKNGKLLWEKTYGGSNYDVSRQMIKDNNGIYVYGMTRSTDGDISSHFGTEENHDLWLIKTDYEGNLEWEKTYGGSKYDFCQNFIRFNDSILVIGATTESSDGDVITSKGRKNVWLAGLDINGELQWDFIFGDSLNNNAHQIFKTPDGGFWFSYSFEIPWNSQERRWILKFAPAGTSASDNQDNSLALTINQNPAVNSINFTITSEPGEALKVELYDLSGNVIYENTLISSVINQLNINSSGLSNGVYQLVVRSQKGVVTERVVVAR